MLEGALVPSALPAFQLILELGSGRRVRLPTSEMLDPSGSTYINPTASATPNALVWTVNSPKRDPLVLARLRGDDIED